MCTRSLRTYNMWKQFASWNINRWGSQTFFKLTVIIDARNFNLSPESYGLIPYLVLLEDHGRPGGLHAHLSHIQVAAERAAQVTVHVQGCGLPQVIHFSRVCLEQNIPFVVRFQTLCLLASLCRTVKRWVFVTSFYQDTVQDFDDSPWARYRNPAPPWGFLKTMILRKPTVC